MAPQPVVTGLSPKEGPPGTRITIRGEFLGTRPSDLVGLTICGCDCLLSAEWKSSNKIIAHTGPAKGKGDIIVTTVSGGVGTSTVQFRAYHETIGPMKESAVWVEESSVQSLAWGRRNMAPVGYTQEDPLGLSIEGNDKKFPEDIRDLFPDGNGDLSQENFSPGWFLLENHHATSFEDLKAGLAYIRRKVESQKEGQLSFLKSNAGSVLDQLDTLMTIRSKLKDDNKLFGTDTLKNLEDTIQYSITSSSDIFRDVLERREKADSTRAALTTLNRHKFLFCLPNSVDRCVDSGEYDIIVNDYSRARNLFGKVDIPIFCKVLEEVDIRILNIRRKLHQQLVQLPQSVEQQKKIIKTLINLEIQQADTKAAKEFQAVDPAWDAIEARAKYLEATFKKACSQYSLKDANAEKSKYGGESDQLPNRVIFCEEICEISASQLPDIWRLGQSYFAGELRGANDPKPGDFKKIILTGIEKMCAYLRSAIFYAFDLRSARQLFPITWPTSGSTQALAQFVLHLPQCLRFIRIAYASLIQLDLPGEALDIIQKLIDEVRIFCLSSFFKRAIDKIKKLADSESWQFAVEEYPGVTGLPSLLEKIIVETLEEGQNVCMNAEIRENNLMDAHLDAQREVSQRLQDMLVAFCDVIEKLAYEIHEEDAHTPIVSQMIGFPNAHTSGFSHRYSVMPWEQRMLCCLANCLYSDKTFFTDIGLVFVKFGYPTPKSAVDVGRSHANHLFSNLLEGYVEHKGDPVVGTIEPSMYIGHFQWNAVEFSGKLRPYAQECCDNLVGVYSEIFTISPLLLYPILEPIVQTVAEELARLMSCAQDFNRDGVIQANVDIRLLRDALKSFSNRTAKSYFGEALEVMGPVSKEDNAKIEETLKKLKAQMSLQILCFSIDG